MKKLKKAILVLIILTAAFAAYVITINRNSVNMSPRQKILKAVYPAWMWFTGLRGKGADVLENKGTVPPVSFYTLQMTENNGNTFSFSNLKGKKVLLVNTASDCGYTSQYESLQKLYEQEKEKLVIIAFPANDFKQQEKNNDEEIASFCKKNYGTTFPLMQKSIVVKSAEQNVVFQWLTNSSKNGWNNKAPSWNFSKYLIDEEGKLVNYFGPSVSPLGIEVAKAIAKN